VDDNEKNDPGDEHSTEFINIKYRVKQFREDYFKDAFEDGQIPDNYFHTTVIPNWRTHAHSGTGAWNSALYRSVANGRERYIAILDDDDEWQNDYLKRCLEKIRENRSGTTVAVVSGITRLENDRSINLIPSSENFTMDQLFIGNPGFQGSNIFIRLRDFMDIGAFDESLYSATDRDLGIRLIQYVEMEDKLSIDFISEPLVIHHAENEERVTSIGKNKKLGLDLFYRKYIHLMKDDIEEKSLQRAKNLFNYNFSEISEEPAIGKKEFKQIESSPFNLVIGVTTSNENNIKEFLQSFIHNHDINLLNDYRIIIFENTVDEFKIRPIVNYFKNEKDLKIDFITNEDQEKLLENYPFRDLFKHESYHNKSIAFSRSLIQYYCYEISKELYDLNNVAWIIDDDLTFHCLEADKSQSVVNPQDYYDAINYYKKNKSVDAILGTVVDAPPLPFLSSLRTQVLDIFFNLQWFATTNPENPFDRNHSMNYPLIKNNRDFYYDLSNHYHSQLECPLWWLPIDEDPELIKQAFQMFLKDLAMFHNGANICRPIFLDDDKWGLDEGHSILRGGNTIIFDLEMLKVPNLIPSVNYCNKQISPRRSDFNWALLNSRIFGKEIRQINLPLRHHRRLQKTIFKYDRDKLVRDMFGMIFYRVFDNLLNVGIDILEGKHYDHAKIRFEKHFRHYLSSLKINLYRSRTLIKMIIGVLENEKNWWYKNKYRETLNDDLQTAISSLKSIQYEVEKRNIQDLTRSLDNNFKRIDEGVFKDIIDLVKKIRSTIN